MYTKYYVGTLHPSELLVCIKPDKRKKTPHFTVTDPMTSHSRDIRLKEAKYYRRYHDGDLTLTKYECDLLQNWLKSASTYIHYSNIKDKSTITNYDVLMDLWNQHNPDLKMDTNTVQQDYSSLYKNSRSLVSKLLEGE